MNTFVVLVENKPGVLTRVASLIRRRGFNIESLTVGHTETAGVSRMTIVVDTDEFGARRVEANLYKLINVLRVDNVTGQPSVTRDLALVKVTATRETRTEIMQLAEAYRARIVDVATELADDRGHRHRGEGRQHGRRAAALRHPRDGAHRPRHHGARRRSQQPAMTRTFEDVETAGRRRGFLLGVRTVSSHTHRREPMAAQIYYDKDADLSLIQGKKVAIIGYGSQGHAHALNLKDSGVNVKVGVRAGSPAKAKAEAAGIAAVPVADAAAVGRRDHDAGARHGAGDDLSRTTSRRTSSPGKMLMFAHGFNIRFGTIQPPADVDVTMIAPKSPGHRVREVFQEGGGVPALVAVHQDATGHGQRARAVVRQGDRRDPRRRARDDVHRRDRDRSLRRAGGALRRRSGAGQGRLRDAGRGRLSAREWPTSSASTS